MCAFRTFFAVVIVTSGFCSTGIYAVKDLKRPDKVNYRNHVFPESGSIAVRRRWWENQRAHFFCPKNSFIERVTYNFGTTWALRKDWEYRGLEARPSTAVETQLIVKVAGSNNNNNNTTSTLKRYNRNMTEEQALKNSVPQCSGLLHCLGHQACVFKVTVEFCGIDAYPHSHNEVLDVVFQCTLDSHLYRHNRAYQSNRFAWVRDTRDSVLSMSYEEHASKSDTIILHKNYFRESDIFELDCPPAEDALKYGYAGVCRNSPPSQQAITYEVWHKLARTKVPSCQKELLQAFCAYKYNSSGGCVPPALVQPLISGSSLGQKSWGFSFKSLPNPGPRPDMQEHNQLLSHPHVQLIPARLAFAILVHKSPDAVIHLLKSLYRTEHYFVIHVDKRKDSVRTDLIWKIINAFGLVENIRVLPVERSFTASWGSYEIVRAELECFEELLQMGPWDFAIDLSGADLPLRNVDDISAMLASVRGHTFFRTNINGRWKSWQISQPKFRTVWYSCDCHVFNISSRVMPYYIDMYSASQWAVFSREAAEMLVSPSREGLHHIQFYTQTSLIPDESYMKSTMMMSHLRDTIVGGNFHVFQHFALNDEKGFCRHSDDIDFCGQGPMDFKDPSLHHLQTSSFSFMFARKFDDNVTSHLRQELAKWRRGGFYDYVKAEYVRQDFLELLAELVLHKKYGFQWRKSVHKPVVKEWKLLPVARPTDACCQAVFSTRNPMVQNKRYWVDFDVTEINGPTSRMRGSLLPRRQAECYCQGHLKTLQLMGTNKYGGRGLDNPPHPYDLAFGKHLTIRAQFKLDGKTNVNCHEVENLKQISKRFQFLKRDYFHFVSFGQNKTLHFKADIFDPSGKLHCHKVLTFKWSVRSHFGPEDAQYLVSNVYCGELKTGWWTLTLHQLNVENAFPYTTKIHLVKRKWFNDDTKERLYGLWQVEDMMELPLGATFYDISGKSMKSNDGVPEASDTPIPSQINTTTNEHYFEDINAPKNENHDEMVNDLLAKTGGGYTNPDKAPEPVREKEDAEPTVAKQPETAAKATRPPIQPQDLGGDVNGADRAGEGKEGAVNPLQYMEVNTESDSLDRDRGRDLRGDLELDVDRVKRFEKDVRMHNIQRRFLVAGSQVEKPEQTVPAVAIGNLDNQVVLVPEERALKENISNLGLKLILFIAVAVILTKGILVPLKLVKLERRNYRGIFLVFITVAVVQSLLYTYAQIT